jgi:hypothetical protein
MCHLSPITMLACAALMLLGTGCRETGGTERGPGPRSAGGLDAAPRLRAVLVSDQTPVAHRPVDLSTRADQTIRSALLASGRFVSASGDDLAACAAEVDLMYAWVVNGKVVAQAAAGVARMVIEGQVHCLIPGGRGEETETYRAEVADEAPFGNPGQASGRVALDALLARLSDTMASHLSGQVRMRHASDGQVLAALKPDQDPGVLMEAASEAGERELVAALGSLIALTRHLDDTVALRAAAAVGRLASGDEASARALAAMTTGSDIERHLVAVQALGDVGGSRAGRYLDTLADGHPDPTIRSAARQASIRARSTPDSE